MSDDQHIIVIECGDGWLPLVDAAATICDAFEAQLVRAYTDDGTLEFDVEVEAHPYSPYSLPLSQAVNALRNASIYLCESCGSPKSRIDTCEWECETCP